MGNWEANDKLLETVNVKYQELQDAMGNRYASVMEGYGNMVAIMNLVEAYFKSCKKSVHKFVPPDGPIAMETTRDTLISMENEAVLLANASMAMAERMRLFHDTVVDIAGGDLLDLIEEDGDERSA